MSGAMDDYELMLKQILNAIDTRIDIKLNNLGYDRTITGVIQQINSDKCTVLINGETSICKIRNGLDIAVGDIVQIAVPNGNYSEKYVDSKLGIPN